MHMQKQGTNHKARELQVGAKTGPLRVRKVINISQGSVATRVRCDRISSDHYCEFTDSHGGSNLKLDSMR